MVNRTHQSNRPITISRWRLNAILLASMLLVGALSFRLGDVQVARHEWFATRANREINQTLAIQPQRGTIRDSKGNVLALDVDHESLYVIPALVDKDEAPRLAMALSGLLNIPSGEILAKLLDQDHYWLPIKRWLDDETADRIQSLKEPALRMVYEPRRVYPQGTFAAHTIGAVNFAGDGISGIEGYYDKLLRGATGVITAEMDATNNPIWIAPQESRPASNGFDLQLTLDPLIQYEIQDALERAIIDNRADSGTIIVMDVQTGAIRGMASYPTFDPNKYNEYPAEMYNLNPAIGQVYEPGSTFKIFTVAAGLESGAFTQQTVVDDGGSIYRYGYSLSNWNGAGNGPINPEQILYYSSNVGALQLAELIGPEAFYDATRRFGYGQPTGVDLAGESPGLVPDPNSPAYSPLQLNTNGYGQGIAVTPLQQVRMMAAIGNDGMLMRPYLVQQRCRGNDCVPVKPYADGRVVSVDVARAVRAMLVSSANHYAPVVWAAQTGDYGDSWLVPGYRVCAKTGTSSVPNGQGGYENWTIGSVLGLVPADQPRYAVLVKIDRAREDIWGVRTAIPVYQKIAERLLRYERLKPDETLAGPGQTAGMPPQR